MAKRAAILEPACRANAARQLDAAIRMHDERDDGPDQKHHEQYFCDAGRARRNPAKTEKRGNERDDQKYDSVMQHKRLHSLVVTFREEI